MSSEFRILDYNYLFDSSVLLTPSSEDAAFPVENISHFHRSKAWHSAGCFVINSANDKLNFADGGGELTATIASATYATPAALAAAIDTALEAAGGANYTVAFSSSTGKWTITSDGGTFSLLCLTGADGPMLGNTSIFTTIGFSVAADLSGALTYTGTLIAIHTEESVVIDLGASEPINSFAILFDRYLGSGLTSSAVLKLQGNASNSWASPSVDTTLSVDSNWDVVTHFYSSNQTYRYWRIKIVDPQNPVLYISLPTCFLSLATQLSQQPQMGMALSRKDLSRSPRTAYGHRYTDIYPTLRQVKFAYANLLESDVQTLELIYERVGSVTPIMLCLDATGSVFDKDRFALYGYLGEDQTSENQFYTYFNIGLVLEEAA